MDSPISPEKNRSREIVYAWGLTFLINKDLPQLTATSVEIISTLIEQPERKIRVSF